MPYFQLPQCWLTSIALFHLSRTGMANATDVIFTGGSAGGLTAYLQVHAHKVSSLMSCYLQRGHAESPQPFPFFYTQADYVRSYLPTTINVRILGDAGFFLDHETAAGQQYIQPMFQTMFQLMNSSFGVNDACIRG